MTKKNSEDLDPMDFKDFKKVLFENDPETEKLYNELQPLYEIISQFIKIRNKEKVSQYELAEKTGIKQPSIARFESGRLKNVSIEYLSKILKPMGYRPKVIFEKIES
jgi:DNA-binding Xre family transcriptional regulator